jgi:hypothetical protein
MDISECNFLELVANDNWFQCLKCRKLFCDKSEHFGAGDQHDPDFDNDDAVICEPCIRKGKIKRMKLMMTSTSTAATASASASASASATGSKNNNNNK